MWKEILNFKSIYKQQVQIMSQEGQQMKQISVYNVAKQGNKSQINPNSVKN